MTPPPPVLLLLTFLIPFSFSFSSSAPTTPSPPPPPPHQSHLTKHKFHLKNETSYSDSYQQYFEITRPLPVDSLIPSCTLPVFSHDFNNTFGQPPTTAVYFPPVDCTWSHAALHLTVASNGSQYDRISAVWLDGVELLRTSTAQPTPGGVFWNVRKDLTRYSSLLRGQNLTLSVMLENIVNEVYTGVYRVNITFVYYETRSNAVSNGLNFPLSLYPPNQKSTVLKLNREENSDSLDLYENPANLIIPVSENGFGGFWYRIEKGFDVKNKSIQIPSNTYKAVIEVYVSFHGDDEFWYSNPPDSYIEINNLETKRGHGAFREVLVTIDGIVVGSVIPFPVIFTGGINPLSWEPIVSIGAFDLPSYDINLTPFLGMLLDGKVHTIGLRVADAISFWLVDANLHLWLDEKAEQVQAMTLKYRAPGNGIKRESKFRGLDGSFEIEGKRKSRVSGWVNSSMGNLTTYVYRRVKFENTIEFSKSGTEKAVEQKVKVVNKSRLKSDNGSLISRTKVEKKYPLKISTSTSAGSQDNTHLMITNLEHSLTEEKKLNEKFQSSLINTQRSKGWMFVQDHDVVSGAAATRQHYTYRDNFGCYRRRVSATGGKLGKNKTSLHCPSVM